MKTLIRITALLTVTWAASALAGGLEDTAWRLLNITSMDDSVWAPDDPAKYTLAFGADGQASVGADCNRGTGSWTSESDNQLAFGPIAATMALCPPPSISDKYLAQFQWVRSYTMKDGHLFLATLADGSIIEFEPLPPVRATAYGEEIRAADESELRDRLITRLLDTYAADKGIAVEDSELDAFLQHMRSGMEAEGLAADDDLTPEERVEVDAMRRQMGYALIRHWKINKSLYETYGGRIIYQQMGPEALDAMRIYFEAQQKADAFTINDPGMAEAFWQFFADETRHDFMEAGGEDEKRAFARPPWQEAD